MQENDFIDTLITKLKKGTISDEELNQLIDWYRHFNDTDVVIKSVEYDSVDNLKKRIYQRLQDKIKPKSRKGTLHKLLPYAAAAAVFLLITIGVLYNTKKIDFSSDRASYSSNGLDEGAHATLTLGNGHTISLNDKQNGIAIGSEITYLDGSILDNQQLIPYDTSTHANKLVIQTPKSRTYQVKLPDGTQVWLNANSTLKYPSNFMDNQRVVEITGEAYFSVSPRKVNNPIIGGERNLPFKVISGGQEIEVLGTEFNVTAYKDDPQTVTTLIEGKLKVGTNEKSVILSPGQQTSIVEHAIDVRSVDYEQFIAWKKGLFLFQNTPLEEVMNQVSRWYSVEVVYIDEVPEKTFSGKINRRVSLKGVLDILLSSGLNVQLEKDKVVVRKSI